MDPVTVSSVGGNFNRYWYANNNPYRFTDPDGRQACSEGCLKLRAASDRVGGGISGVSSNLLQYALAGANRRAQATRHGSEAAAVNYFGAIGLAFQKRLGREVGANLVQAGNEYKVVDFHYDSDMWAQRRFQRLQIGRLEYGKA